MTTYYREWASKTNARCGNMVRADLIDKIMKRHSPGYTSVYLFDEAAALEILQSGVSQGFAQYVPAAEELVIDLDDGDKSLPSLVGVLAALGVAFKVYSSGSKGFHVVIPHQFIADERLPYSHQHFVEVLGIKADMSLYRPNSLVAIPGRIHPFTGRRKTLVQEHEGRIHTLAIVEAPVRTDGPPFNFEDEMPEHNKRVSGLFMLTKLVGGEPEAGNRHLSLWKTAKMLQEGGFSLDAIEPLIQEINASWSNPKSPEEVSHALNGAFRVTKSKRVSLAESVKPGRSTTPKEKPSSQTPESSLTSTTKTGRSRRSKKSGTDAPTASSLSKSTTSTT